MPLYEFRCDQHSTFEVFTRMGGQPDEAPCPSCGKRGTRIFSAPALVNVQRDWNEKANNYQRDPYTQARAQLTNVAREEAERSGRSPRPISEESVQVAAKAIADKQPKKSIVQRTIDARRAANRKARTNS